MVEIRCGLVSITGNFRENNEDRALVDPDHRFFIVCDGMGGQAAGEKASEMAVDFVSKELERFLESDETSDEKVIEIFDKSVELANAEIMALGELEPAFHNMGTTIVMLVVVGGKLFVAGVGDSRVYRLRDGKLEQLTVDHSLTQALIEHGTITLEEAANHRYKNVLWRYLGTKEGGTGTNPKVLDPKSGDRFFLCSDGVTDGLDDEPLAALLQENDDPQDAAEKIVEAAQEGGSKDNITCVVIHIV